MFMPMPSRPADVYTVRIAAHEAQTSLAMSLRRIIAAAGGTFMMSLMEGPGFMFRLPTTEPCPFTSFAHGGLLEEGCLHVSKTRLGSEDRCVTAEEESDSGEVESDVESVEEDVNHPGLNMQWSWTELKTETK